MVTKNFEKISDEKKEQIITKGIEIFSKGTFYVSGVGLPSALSCKDPEFKY